MKLFKIMIRLWRTRWLPIALLAAGCPQYLQAGSLEKVWEVDLKKALQGERLDPPRSFKVNKVLFSPNAQQIAVLMARSTVLFRVQDSQAVPGLIQKDPWNSFIWSSDGQTIESAGRVVHLLDRKACELPPHAIAPTFIGNGSLIAPFLDPNPFFPMAKSISPRRILHISGTTMRTATSKIAGKSRQSGLSWMLRQTEVYLWFLRPHHPHG